MHTAFFNHINVREIGVSDKHKSNQLKVSEIEIEEKKCIVQS